MDFIYNGENSSDYGIIVTKVSQPSLSMSRDSIVGERTKYRPRVNMFGTRWSDSLSFTITVMKDFCKCRQQSELAFTSTEISKITAWLTSPQFYHIFKFVGNDYFRGDNVEYFALIRDIRSVEDMGQIFQLEFEVECDSPFAWSEEYTQSVTSTASEAGNLIIDNNGDELEDYVYPLIQIDVKEHGDIAITNVTDSGRSMTVKGLRAMRIFIDSQKRKFTDSTGKLVSFTDIGIADVDKILFPRLCHGENELQITGDAEVTIKYRVPRKVGAF